MGPRRGSAWRRNACDQDLEDRRPGRRDRARERLQQQGGRSAPAARGQGRDRPAARRAGLRRGHRRDARQHRDRDPRARRGLHRDASTTRRARWSRRASCSTRSTRGPSRPASPAPRPAWPRPRRSSRARTRTSCATSRWSRRTRSRARSTRPRSRSRRPPRPSSRPRKAMVEQAEIDLSYTKVTAPEDGLVGKHRGLRRHARRPRPEHAAHAHLAHRPDPRALQHPGEGLPRVRAQARRERRAEDGDGPLAFELILADGSVHPRAGQARLRRPQRRRADRHDHGRGRLPESRRDPAPGPVRARAARRSSSARARSSCRSAPCRSCRASSA